MKTVIPQRAVADFRDMFLGGTDSISFERDGNFFICKLDYTHEQVEGMVMSYFSDKRLPDGWEVAIDPTVYFYTQFTIREKKKEE